MAATSATLVSVRTNTAINAAKAINTSNPCANASGRAASIPTDLSLIRDGMRAVVADTDGTVFFPFRGFPLSVAGKSGTAETTGGDPDGWFIGFASFEAPSIAFAAVFEEFHESAGNFASQTAGTATRSVVGAKFGVK